MRSPHLLLACALVLAPIAGVPLSTTEANTPTASGSPGTIKQPINNSVSHLTIKAGQTKNTSIETVTIDAGGAVAFDGSIYRQEIRKEQFDATLKNASDRQEVINSALDRVENRTTELQTRQKKAIKNYNDGTLSAQAFLRELAAIFAEANQMRVFAAYVYRKSQRWESTTRAQQLKQEFTPLIGSVRPIVQSTLNGDPGSPKQFFVRTSAQGVVLATVDDGEYFREAYLSGAKAGPNATGSISNNKADDIINSSYPSIDTNNSDLLSGVSHYVFRGGRLTAMVDRSSGKIFSDQQRLLIDDERTVRGPRNTSGPFALVTNTTYTGGYMIVRLTNPENGNKLNGTITVDNKTVGTTEDGELYMLQPPNGTTINATVDGETVSVTVGKPMGPPESGLSIREERRNKWQQLGNILF